MIDVSNPFSISPPATPLARITSFWVKQYVFGVVGYLSHTTSFKTQEVYRGRQ
jgi:hypothetical protein